MPARVSQLMVLAALALLAVPASRVAHAEAPLAEAERLRKEGIAHRKRSDNDGALKKFSAGLAVAGNAGLHNEEIYVLLQNGLAEVYRDKGELDKAVRLFQASLRILRKKNGDDFARKAAITQSALGEVYQRKWDLVAAENHYRAALAELEKRPLGKASDLPAITARHNLATLYVTERRDARAEQLFRRNLDELKRDAAVEARRFLAVTLKQYGQLHFYNRRYKEAEACFQQALAIWAKDAPEGLAGKTLASCRINLGQVCIQLANLDEAEGYLKQSLQATAPGDRGEVLLCLGRLRYHRKRYAEAEELCRQALRLIEDKAGKDHPEIAPALHFLARVCAAAGEHGRAADHMDRSRRILRRHISNRLALLPESAHLPFLQRANGQLLDAALSLGLLAPQRLAERSAEWLVNAKGETQEALTRYTARASGNRDRAAKDRRRLLDLRRQLAALAEPLPAGKESEAQRRRRLERTRELTEQEGELAAELRRSLGPRLVDNPWIRLESVRGKLPRGACFIDVARVARTDFLPRRENEVHGEARYVAWVIPSTGAVKVVDLGPASAIDPAVAEVRAAIAGKKVQDAFAADSRTNVYEKFLHQPLTKVSKAVLHPLLKHVGASTRLIISPDDQLWLLPWHALLLPEGKRFAVQDYVIEYVVSGRDLVAAPSPRGNPSPPLILASPDYGVYSRRTNFDFQTPNPDTFRKEGQAARKPLSRFWVGQAKTGRGKPGKGKKKGSSTGPVFRRGERATKEELFKARGPAVLYLVTHGFCDDADKGGTDPLLQCGLALARANESWADGVLTGREATGLDLRGTRLVVLSACETGVGKASTGEQARCLRQAFQLAGARAVVATLWSVPDPPSLEIMRRFLAKLGPKADLAEALCQAQREQIKEDLKVEKCAHPFFWAGYTLTGR